MTFYAIRFTPYAMSKTIRAFIAVELSSEVKSELARLSQTLAKEMPERSVRWVKPENIHLTLRFLGDTAVDKLPAISQSLAELGKQHHTFTLKLHELGVFPNRKRPRVIWVGLSGNVEALQSLKRDLDSQLAPLGWAKENKPFRAHLTLGRVKDGRQLAKMKWDVKIEPVAFNVTAVALIESELTRQGPIYTTRHQVSLPET